jgi:hypothetical protein
MSKEMGRPTDYTHDVSIDICARIAEGMPLTKICKLDGMPHVATVYRWLADERYKDFRDRYMYAREDQADTLADEIVEIADDTDNDYTETVDGILKYNAENVNRSRLRVDARKWVAAKLKPKKYGDKVQNELTGADGGAIKTESDSSPDDIARQVAFLLSKGVKK